MLNKGKDKDQPEGSAAFKKPVKYLLIVLSLVEVIVLAVAFFKSRR
jgi:hypothetical protein